MKKILSIITILLISISVLSAFEIETSRGTITLEVPNNMTIEEAYCTMAKMYLEERWEHEALIEDSKELTEKVDSYIQENETLKSEYEKVLSMYKEKSKSYEELTSLYVEQIKLIKNSYKPYINLSYNQDFNMTSFNIRADFGIMLWNKFNVFSSISNESFGIGLGYVF